jgi:hypothetical protein
MASVAAASAAISRRAARAASGPGGSVRSPASGNSDSEVSTFLARRRESSRLSASVPLRLAWPVSGRPRPAGPPAAGRRRPRQCPRTYGPRSCLDAMTSTPRKRPKRPKRPSRSEVPILKEVARRTLGRTPRLDRRPHAARRCVRADAFGARPGRRVGGVRRATSILKGIYARCGRFGRFGHYPVEL